MKSLARMHSVLSIILGLKDILDLRKFSSEMSSLGVYRYRLRSVIGRGRT